MISHLVDEWRILLQNPHDIGLVNRCAHWEYSRRELHFPAELKIFPPAIEPAAILVLCLLCSSDLREIWWRIKFIGTQWHANFSWNPEIRSCLFLKVITFHPSCKDNITLCHKLPESLHLVTGISLNFCLHCRIRDDSFHGFSISCSIFLTY